MGNIKNKMPIIILFVLFALPVPVALLGSFMSFVWFLASLVKERSVVEIIVSLLGTAIGLIYLCTYIFALKKTWKEQRITSKTFVPIAHCILALVFLLCLKPASNYIDKTTQYFGLVKKDFYVVEESDTHGGFHGDGSYCLILDCADNREKALETVKNWNKMPLPENLNIIMYGGKRNDIEYGYKLAEKAHIPKIKNGYYMFEDRHSESKDSTDDSEIFDRYSFNFSIAIYDTDYDKMYYLAFDT